MAEGPTIPIPNEVVLAEFGFTPEDFERMGERPLKQPAGIGSRRSDVERLQRVEPPELFLRSGDSAVTARRLPGRTELAWGGSLQTA